MNERKRAIFYLIWSTLLWSLPPIFIKYLSGYFDPFTQNFFRYSAAAIVLFVFCFIRFRDSFSLSRTTLLRLMRPTIPNVLFQVLWVVALYKIYPAFAVLIGRIWVVFVAFLSFIFFPEERSAIKSPKFTWGTFLVLAGASGVVIFKGGILFDASGIGTILIILSSLGWAFYTIEIKRAVRDVEPVISFTVVSIYTTLLLMPLAFIFGNPASIVDTPMQVKLVLIVSGLACLALAHPLYYASLKHLDTGVCSSFLQGSILFTALISYLSFGEVLTTGQILSGAVLLTGAVLVILVRRKY